jgi:hypothetical protein
MHLVGRLAAFVVVSLLFLCHHQPECRPGAAIPDWYNHYTITKNRAVDNFLHL